MRPKATSSYVDLEGLAQAEESWSAQQVEVFQLTQLRRTIRMAQTCCPLYRQRFARHGVSYLDLHTAKDLSRFPFLTQDDIDNNVDQLLNQNFGRKLLRRSSDSPDGLLTSTTTKGTPSEQKEKVFLEQLLRRSGVTAQDRIIFICDEINMSKARSRPLSTFLRKRWMTFSASDILPDAASFYLDKVVGFKPHAIVAYPSAITTLALQLLEEKRTLRHELKAIICLHERLDPPQRTFLEKTFKTKVISRYGQPNRLATAAQTLDNDLYHFSPGYGFAELDEPDSNGMQEIIATSFHDDRLPLVRYRTGDLVSKEVTDQSAKAFPWLAVKGFSGRSDEFVVDNSGQKIRPVQLSFDAAPFKKIVATQLFQDNPGYILLRYSATDELTKHEQKQLKRQLNAAVGKEFKIAIRETRWLTKNEMGAVPWLTRTDFATPSQKSRNQEIG